MQKKDLYFFSYDSAFYWVRCSTLESLTANKSGFSISKVTQVHKVNTGTILVFNRFSISLFYRLAYKFAKFLKIPYIVDIDDLFWELPGFSSDLAADSKIYISQLDDLLKGANVITTTNEFLKGELEKRYQRKTIIVPNARTSWYAPKGGVIIANTDSFKMNEDEKSWFNDILKDLAKTGIAVQFLGNNEAVLEGIEFDTYSLPQMAYSSYLSFLANSGFKVGIIPVSDSNYADAKSDIKIQEFLAAGSAVFASDIRPYREYSKRFPNTGINLIRNNEQEWRKAAAEIKSICDDAAMRAAVIAESTLRKAQFNAWLEVVDAVKTAFPAENKYKFFSYYVRFYLCYLSRAKSMLKFLLSPLRILKRSHA
jgi:hypothetical protein